MDENLGVDEFSQWFSTYGVITSQRILGHYQITLPPKELMPAVKNRTSFYHTLVQVPLKNVLNGIIFQQANDYHVYAQKLYIDYLLSGESGKPPEAPGASTREALEEERQELVNLGEEFNKKQTEHETLISLTQNSFIKLTRELKEYFETGITLTHAIIQKYGLDTPKSLIKDSVVHALIYCGMAGAQDRASRLQFINTMNDVAKISMSNELKEDLIEQLANIFDVMLSAHDKIDDFLASAQQITQVARSFRKQFYDKVLRVIELMTLLPEYKINSEQDAVNRESLYFDSSIGD